jgi:hypothetical protein
LALSSLADWLKLPEVICPVVSNETTKGSAYKVYKVGFLALSPADCGNTNVSGAMLQAGRYLFPTAEIEFGGEKQLCKLPLPLTGWALDSVAMTKMMNGSPFPMTVEFGILRNRHYAEML